MVVVEWRISTGSSFRVTIVVGGVKCWPEATLQ